MPRKGILARDIATALTYISKEVHKRNCLISSAHCMNVPRHWHCKNTFFLKTKVTLVSDRPFVIPVYFLGLP